MLQGLLKLLSAAAIAFGIVYYVTEGDLRQVVAAAEQAAGEAMARKRAQVEAANASAEAEPEEPGPRAVPVVTQRSVAQALESRLRMTGVTEASRTVQVPAQTAGVVTVAPRKGMRVRQGDLLCRLDLGDRAARREAAVARLRQAVIDEQAQRALSQKGYAAANRAATATASADAARAEIAQIDVDIGRLEIRAPFAGVIEGQPAELGAMLGVGQSCATLVDPDPLRVVGFAPENRVGDLREGGAASATLASGAALTGRIAHIAQSADLATRTFRVEIEAANPDYRLRDGLTADIVIPLAGKRAHLLPQSALTLNDAGEIGVMVAREGRAAFVPVRMERNDDEGAWLLGLPDTADVIVVGQEFVDDGARIEATRRAGAAYLGEGS